MMAKSFRGEMIFPLPGPLLHLKHASGLRTRVHLQAIIRFRMGMSVSPCTFVLILRLCSSKSNDSPLKTEGSNI